jgi:hypothetical protein
LGGRCQLLRLDSLVGHWQHLHVVTTFLFRCAGAEVIEASVLQATHRNAAVWLLLVLLL